MVSKDEFLSTYSNVPKAVRGEVIVVIDDTPYSWDAAYQEVKNETDLGEKILDKLDTLDPDTDVTEEKRELVVHGLRNLPGDVQLHTGTGEKMDKHDLIEHVKAQDQVGQDYVKTQLEYLQYMKKGKVHG